jgi:biopolymer transport protein ExbB/TolQ
MSVAGTGGFKVVSQGIAAALVATAAGLMVAIYAIIAYNYFISKVGAIAIEYKVFCEEFLMAMGEYAKNQENPLMGTGTAPLPAGKKAPSA